MCEDITGEIRSCKLKERQYNGQQKKDNRTKNDPYNTTQNTED